MPPSNIIDSNVLEQTQNEDASDNSASRTGPDIVYLSLGQLL